MGISSIVSAKAHAFCVSSQEPPRAARTARRRQVAAAFASVDVTKRAPQPPAAALRRFASRCDQPTLGHEAEIEDSALLSGSPGDAPPINEVLCAPLERTCSLRAEA
jgi:hypothetical protein